jgi:hypothetical protein
VPAFGVTFVSEVDVSTPLGVDCRLVEFSPGAGLSKTKWNAGLRFIRLLLEA